MWQNAKSICGKEETENAEHKTRIKNKANECLPASNDTITKNK